ncbi:MAG TPA: glycoside hydrolase family 66 protein [Micromonosporaceae bacterium]
MLLPSKSCYRPGEPVTIELSPAPVARRATVTRLGTTVATVDVASDADVVTLPALPEGGYAVRVTDPPDGTDPSEAQWTAVEVLADPVARMRYGFVASYPPDRDVADVQRFFRRLHLTAAQFYDWAYRHANLVGPTEYADPLGQPVSMATVRRLAAGLRDAGTAPLGYAAVYGVGEHEWPDWRQAALLAPDGTAYSLANFLSLVDPSDPAWLEHFTADLVRATTAGGFAGFHLDQYGFPRYATRPDGRLVDVAAAFDTLIRRVREALPEAVLVFNNVNDFPTWATSRSPQNATYIEVWPPHERLADLAATFSRAKALAPTRPAIAAAYQTVYAAQPVEVADTTTRLTMATLFSHGATQLLAGEAGNVLVDPYYVNNRRAEAGTLDLLARWYDLLVAAGDVLLGPDLHDITGSVAGSFNDEVDVVAPDGVPVTGHADAGVVWRRVVHTPYGLLVHLINLTGQDETGWDTPKKPLRPVSGLRLRVRRAGSATPTVRVADPDRGPAFTTIPTTTDGNHAHTPLPPLRAWQLVLVSYHAATEELPR